MFFMFWEERDVKERKITYLAPFVIDVGNRTQTELILGGQSDKFQSTSKQLKFGQTTGE